MSHYLTLRGVGQPIAYFPALATYLGSINAAIFLGQIIYWHDKTNNPDGVYKTSLEFEKETGLSYREQVTARKILRENGLISERNKRFEHRIYFKFNHNVFDSWLTEKLSNNQDITTNDENAVREQQKRSSLNDENAVREQPIKHFVIQENTTEENKQNITDIQFEEFWKTVPNKDGKKPALAAFKKAIKKISLEDLILAYKANVQVCESQNRFKKNPATWLNQECWNDESIQSVLNTLKNPQPVQAEPNAPVAASWVEF